MALAAAANLQTISATRKHEPVQLNDNPHRLPVQASRWPKARRCDKPPLGRGPRDRLVLAENQSVHHGEPTVAPCARHQVYPDWGGRRWIPVYNHAAGPSVRIFLSALSSRPERQSNGTQRQHQRQHHSRFGAVREKLATLPPLLPRAAPPPPPQAQPQPKPNAPASRVADIWAT